MASQKGTVDDLYIQYIYLRAHIILFLRVYLSTPWLLYIIFSRLTQVLAQIKHSDKICYNHVYHLLDSQNISSDLYCLWWIFVWKYKTIIIFTKHQFRKKKTRIHLNSVIIPLTRALQDESINQNLICKVRGERFPKSILLM